MNTKVRIVVEGLLANVHSENLHKAGPRKFTQLKSARRNRHTAVTAKRGHSEAVWFCAESSRFEPVECPPIRTRRGQGKTFFSDRRSQVRTIPSTLANAQCHLRRISPRTGPLFLFRLTYPDRRSGEPGVFPRCRLPLMRSFMPGTVKAIPAGRCADQTLVNDGVANIADFALRTAGSEGMAACFRCVGGTTHRGACTSPADCRDKQREHRALRQIRVPDSSLRLDARGPSPKLIAYREVCRATYIQLPISS